MSWEFVYYDKSVVQTGDCEYTVKCKGRFPINVFVISEYTYYISSFENINDTSTLCDRLVMSKKSVMKLFKRVILVYTITHENVNVYRVGEVTTTCYVHTKNGPGVVVKGFPQIDVMKYINTITKELPVYRLSFVTKYHKFARCREENVLSMNTASYYKFNDKPITSLSRRLHNTVIPDKTRLTETNVINNTDAVDNFLKFMNRFMDHTRPSFYGLQIVPVIHDLLFSIHSFDDRRRVLKQFELRFEAYKYLFYIHDIQLPRDFTSACVRNQNVSCRDLRWNLIKMYNRVIQQTPKNDITHVVKDWHLRLYEFNSCVEDIDCTTLETIPFKDNVFICNIGHTFRIIHNERNIIVPDTVLKNELCCVFCETILQRKYT